MADAGTILMPKLGLTMSEGVLASWNVKPGDEVSPGDVLFVVETEKIATEVEAPAAGRIGDLLVAEGRTVPVGTVVATWSGPAASGGQTNADRVVGELARPARVIATPLARRLASQRSIDLARVVGTGPRGRIAAKDVELASKQSAPERPVPQPIEQSRSRRPATRGERLRAQRLLEAKQAIPHFNVVMEVDATLSLQFRDELNAAPGASRLTLNHVIVAAVGRALLQLPECNCVWENDEIVTFSTADVGIVVDAPGGLIVPILRDAGRLSLFSVAEAARDLVNRTRDGRLIHRELEGGAVSVSNVGMHGAIMLTPIIALGQSMMIGVGATRPVFRPDGNGAPSLRQEIALTLAGDHRVLDGVKGTRFLGAIRDFVEHPLWLIDSRMRSIGS